MCEIVWRKEKIHKSLLFRLMIIVSFVLKIWLSFCKLRHVLNFISAVSLSREPNVIWVKKTKKKRNQITRTKLTTFEASIGNEVKPKVKIKIDFTLTFIHMAHAQITTVDQVTSLEGKLLMAYTTTGFTFFCTNLNSTELTAMGCTPKQAIWDYSLCERCWCGIWTQHRDNIDRVNLNVLAYQNDCVDEPDIIYINPVNNDEMDQFFQFIKQEKCMWTISNQKNVNMLSFLFWTSGMWAYHCQTLVRFFKWRQCWCYSTITSTFLVAYWEWCFWVTCSFSTQSAKTKWWNELPTWHFSKGGSDCPSCCVFVVWLLNCVHTPHHPEHFWKTCYGLLNCNKTAKQQRTRHKVEWLLVCFWAQTTYSLRELWNKTKSTPT